MSRVVGALRADKPVPPDGEAIRETMAKRAKQPDLALGMSTKTGETVFDDRALRFRNLTFAKPDLSALEYPADNLSGFKIRVARRSTRRRDAGLLVEDRYANRGYTVPAPKEEPHVSTFIAYDEGVLVGTVSVRVDSEKGLSADELYQGEIDGLRRVGQRLCEFTRLAVDRNTASKPVLAGLFHTAYLYAAVIRGATHAVIEVNPRHVDFYRRTLGFEPIGPERLNARVNAPAVLLCVSFDSIAHGLEQHGGKDHAPNRSRSIFVYGFPRNEAVGVLGRLRKLVDEQ